tara:strand:+ start:419 stop:571 length:153 start_codon:yes stop_codon:yes gene_type:complete
MSKECIDTWSREQLVKLLVRIRKLEAKVEDLHATDSARRLNMATEDPEWY